VPHETPSSSPRETTTLRTHLSGYDLLLHPALNKGTAFTEEERNTFGLHGLLPPHIGTLEDQRERRKKALDNQPTPFAKYTFMRDLQDSDETLFYSLIKHNAEELLPIVYTPAVGEGC
jgi:malate dehydrogenase (oxaloacetate-decarboxylating)